MIEMDGVLFGLCFIFLMIVVWFYNDWKGKKKTKEAIKKLKWARSQCIMKGGLDDIIMQTVMLDYDYVISISEDDFDGKDLIEFCQKVKKIYESETKENNV